MKKFFTCLLSLLLALTLTMGTVSAGYAADETELEPEEELKRTDISNYTVELDSYMVMATGEPFSPQVTKVGDGRRTLKPEDYDISYYKVISFGENISEPVDEICQTGEYKIVAAGKGEYCGETYGLFSVVGKQQHLTLEKTRYSLKMGTKSFYLKPETDGDGTGFEFKNYNPDIISLTAEGKVKRLKAGRAVVRVVTCGDKLYQPANVTVVFEISPAKVTWQKTKSPGKVAWNKTKGTTKYEIEYSTGSKFRKSTTRTKKVSASKDNTSLKNLKAGKTYYVRIRALTEIEDSRGNSKTLKGSWSATMKIKK